MNLSNRVVTDEHKRKLCVDAVARHTAHELQPVQFVSPYTVPFASTPPPCLSIIRPFKKDLVSHLGNQPFDAIRQSTFFRSELKPRNHQQLKPDLFCSSVVITAGSPK
eukprot:TRINITY_DN24955_c0_g1_i2.p1 TRINITY_DN24955_c0_g1~~TRINITY_DN24955_c0_g1_i2.p1  ORF type:complete len:108 (+),score=10.65 TRINITY_DN24955_c0_g1_i2:266-589(+)